MTLAFWLLLLKVEGANLILSVSECVEGCILIMSSAVQFLPYIIMVTLISLSSPGMFTYGDILRNLFFFLKDANGKYNPYFERTSHFFPSECMS